jgi:hypothetical protein
MELLEYWVELVATRVRWEGGENREKKIGRDGWGF